MLSPICASGATQVRESGEVYSSNGLLLYRPPDDRVSEFVRARIRLATRTLSLQRVRGTDARLAIWVLFINRVFSQENAVTSQDIGLAMYSVFSPRAYTYAGAGFREYVERGLRELREQRLKWFGFAETKHNGVNQWRYWLHIKDEEVLRER